MSSVSELISNSKFSAATVSVGPLPLPSTTPSAWIFFFGGGGVLSVYVDYLFALVISGSFQNMTV
jgi:hypothetical protein